MIRSSISYYWNSYACIMYFFGHGSKWIIVGTSFDGYVITHIFYWFEGCLWYDHTYVWERRSMKMYWKASERKKEIRKFYFCFFEAFWVWSWVSLDSIASSKIRFQAATVYSVLLWGYLKVIDLSKIKEF